MDVSCPLPPVFTSFFSVQPSVSTVSDADALAACDKRPSGKASF